MSAKLALFPLFSLVSIACASDCKCYWNGNCLYDMFGTATPYDSVRGDLRDQLDDGGCEVLSIWSLHRHGNRHPGADVTRDISALQSNIKRLLHDPDARPRLNNKINCAQDLEDLMNWRWNSTLENSTSYLTATGYEEVYALGRRMFIQYHKFLKSVEKVSFRATNQQRTITSLMALVHGMTEGTPHLANFSMGIQPSLERDDIIRPYDNCQRYLDEVRNGQLLADELAAYDSSPEFLTTRDRVQSRLPVDYQLTPAEVFTLYELCRFDRSWSETLRSPWCSFIHTRDLLVMEYRDDVRHYYRNGYGSSINLKLGALPLKDLYENFVNVTEGKGKSLVSYFTHDTMLDMVFCALGLYKDSKPIRGSAGIKWFNDFSEDGSDDVDPILRTWRTSEFAAFASNFIAVLSSGKGTKMSAKLVLFLLFSLVSIALCAKDRMCYWNANCMYDTFGTATPYDSVRGDLRDQIEDRGCEVLSIWSLHRHGNRYPGADVTEDINPLQNNIKRLLHDPDAHQRLDNNYCAQDLDDLMKWRWNSTLENSPSSLTATGYEEAYALGRRMFIQYHKFLKSVEKVSFRATNRQRTMTSLTAFIHGMTESTPHLANFSVGIQPSLERDDVIRPYDNCQRYLDEVTNGQLLADELAAYDSSPEFLATRNRVQSRLPVDYQLTPAEVFTLYELCRFDRSWSESHRSPWCSFIRTRDLVVMEYRDDVRHYYRNGYGSSINLKLGALPLKDLYETFANVTEGKGNSLVSYFAHDTMLEMMFCALGLYKDPKPLRGSAGIKWFNSFPEDGSDDVDPSLRIWRTSQFAAFASNFIAVLSRCEESGEQTHRVRLFINEKPTPLCPEAGCTWQQFLGIFQRFSQANLDFCAKEWSDSRTAFMSGRSNMNIGMTTSLFLLVLVLGVLH